MGDAYVNFAVSTVATPPTPASSGVTLTVTAGQGVRFGAIPCNVTIWPAASLPEPNTAEIARLTARNGDVLTLTRAQESTSARTIVAGDLIAQCLTKKFLDELHMPVNLASDISGALPLASLPAHKATHQSGGSDALALDTLAPPTDITTLNASTSAHGLLRKLSGNPTDYLTGAGNFAAFPTTLAPAAHHTAHEAGGSDEVALAQSQVTGLTTALAGKVDTSDPRLTNARTPTAHHTTHEPGGTDVIAALDAGVLTSGTLPAARFPTNLVIQGSITEKNRAAPIGYWTNVPYNLGNYTANPGSWVVESADVFSHMWMLVGNTLTLLFHLSGTTISGSPTELYIPLPVAGVTTVGLAFAPLLTIHDGATSSYGYIGWTAGETRVRLRKDLVSAVAFPNGAAIVIGGQVQIPIA